MAGIKVTAFRAGYYDLMLRAPGTQFELADQTEFSSKWMCKGHQQLPPEELTRLERDSKRRTQAELTAATKGTRISDTAKI